MWRIPMCGRKVASGLICLAWLLASPADAWHRGGHMAVARIAWLQFDDQPAIQKQLIQILDKHPHRDSYLAADTPDGVPLEHWMFLRAATWPDWVRDPQAPKGKPPFTKQEFRDIKAQDKPD